MINNFEKTSVFGKGFRPAAKYQQNEKLRKDIYFEIRKLNTTLHTNRLDSQHAKAIERFIDAMIPSKTGDDPGRLPICAKRPMAPVASKSLCVFYLVSCLVQAYWDYFADESEGNLAKTERGLEILKHVNENYKDMYVSGDVRKGYVLEI